jgi:hypothetical protein
MAFKKKSHGVEIDTKAMDGEKSPRFGKRPSPRAVEEAGHEMKMNPPKQLKKTAAKFGKKRAKKQKIAMMLAKARKGK